MKLEFIVTVEVTPRPGTEFSAAYLKSVAVEMLEDSIEIPCRDSLDNVEITKLLGVRPC